MDFKKRSSLTTEEVQKRLEEIREQYKTSSGVDRDLLRVRGILLRKALDRRLLRS